MHWTWELLLALLPTLPLIAAGYWAWLKFQRERPHAARIQFSIEANVVGQQDSNHIVECVLTFENRGWVKVQIDSLLLLLRGIKRDDPLGFRENLGSQLAFPHRIVKEENIIPKPFGYIFFEPHVVQEYRYITLVPLDYRFVLLHGEFHYDKDNPHTAQKVIDLGVLKT